MRYESRLSAESSEKTKAGIRLRPNAGQSHPATERSKAMRTNRNEDSSTASYGHEVSALQRSEEKKKLRLSSLTRHQFSIFNTAHPRPKWSTKISMCMAVL